MERTSLISKNSIGRNLLTLTCTLWSTDLLLTDKLYRDSMDLTKMTDVALGFVFILKMSQ